MEKEFVTYDQAVALKELGFDEPCLGFYDDQYNKDNSFYVNDSFNQDKRFIYTPAPLKQQVFRWFRDNHKMQAEILWRGDMGSFCYKTGKFKYGEHKFSEKDYKTYEEAESDCIDKLIEIIKNK